jgi:IclR family acetate operon transcriptional repressor
MNNSAASAILGPVASSGPRPLGAVDKAMAALHALIMDGRPMRLAELTRRTGLAKPTVAPGDRNTSGPQNDRPAW